MESLFSRRVLKTRRARARGFTLIEMLVVLVIIVIISSIAISGQNSFSRTEALNNTAYDIGLSIRQAQSYGLANAVDSGDTAAFYNVPFGIAVRQGDLGHYVLFSDTFPTATFNCNGSGEFPPNCVSGNHEYDLQVLPPEVVQSYALNNGFTIGAFCAANSNGSKCSTDNNNPLANLSITFGRPNGQATIAGYTGNNGWKLSYTYACIQITSGSGDSRYVSVSANNEVLVGIKANGDPDAICP